MNQSATTLLDLPVELQLMVFERLDYTSLVPLAHICRTYRDLVKVEPPGKVRCSLRRELLFTMEKWKMYDNLVFACSKCLKLRRGLYFGTRQSLSHPKRIFNYKHLRECLDCWTPSWERGPYYETMSGEKVRHCDKCREWKPSGRWCLRCSACFSCLDIHAPGWRDARATQVYPREPPCPICWPTRLTTKGNIVKNGRPHSMFDMEKDMVTGYGSKLPAL